MTIASEITKLNTNLTNSYTACNNKGATMPANQNFDNLATCIGSIQTGGSPTLQTKSVSLTNKNGQTFSADNGYDGLSQITVTPNNQARTVTPTKQQQSLTVNSGYSGNGTITVNAVTSSIDSNITAGNIKNGVSILGVTGNYTGTTPTGTLSITANGTYDVTNYASANVSVSGGGSEYKHLNGNSLIKNFVIRSINNEYVLENLEDYEGTTFGINELIDSAIFEEIYANDSTIVQFNLENWAYDSVEYDNVTLPNCFIESSLQSFIIGGETNACAGMFYFTFSGCQQLKTVTFKDIQRFYAQRNTGTFSHAFEDSAIEHIYFPDLITNCIISGTSPMFGMLSGVDGCTVHFPSNLQSVVNNWGTAEDGFEGDNTIILFDLPATS